LLLWFESNGSHRHRRVTLFSNPSSHSQSPHHGLDAERLRARRTLRASLRAARRALAPHLRAEAARRIALHVQREFFLHPGQRVAVYAPLPEELDVEPLATLARRHGCEVFVPRLVDRRRRRMRFVAVRGRMQRNHLGILEPAEGDELDPRWLDLVFLPLVGFDTAGMRLGMGGGYYDRAFAYRHLRRSWFKPQLIGVAYALQRIDGILPAAHDVGLDRIVTEEGVLTCSTGY
jgi:5-formyltetrahydrofolate cyclo-ligase